MMTRLIHSLRAALDERCERTHYISCATFYLDQIESRFSRFDLGPQQFVCILKNEMSLLITNLTGC